jgi:hypothetical protein
VTNSRRSASRNASGGKRRHHIKGGAFSASKGQGTGLSSVQAGSFSAVGPDELRFGKLMLIDFLGFCWCSGAFPLDVGHAMNSQI